MFNSAKFSLQQVELEFDKVQERHLHQLKLHRDHYLGSPEVKANVAVMDSMNKAAVSLRKILSEYNQAVAQDKNVKCAFES